MPAARLIAFHNDRTPERVYPSKKPDAVKAYNLEYRASQQRPCRSAGSGQIAPLPYRQQLARELLAKSGKVLEAGAESGKAGKTGKTGKT